MSQVNCSECGRELTNDESVIRGIGPICRSKVLEDAARHWNIRKCDYWVELVEEQKICIIHERHDPDKPTISLTNCIEHVINEVVYGHELCVNTWAFVEHAQDKPHLFGGYQEYDVVELSGDSINWKYLWHNDARDETVKQLTRELLIQRVASWRKTGRCTEPSKSLAT